MFDFSFGELAVIGAVALVVLGPERLPKVARTVGEWAGKAQRYVSQVKADINREMEVAELKKLQEQARGIAHEFESAVQSEVRNIESSVGSAVDAAKGADISTLGADRLEDQWGESGDWARTRFSRRYKPGPSIDELSEEIDKLKRQLAMPETSARSRRKYAPRARVNRPRIRR
ncbi:MAG TPA: Sec-independent protein translocase protein TatB [Burkholderiaceae bacterium]|nr:Sec-independent protein translocase protein TatB [Burkholderiaceae bacterium]HQR70415.1 Sec-independent protein translocase protein TatB [Burkholderiaceae bacterium]